VKAPVRNKFGIRTILIPFLAIAGFFIIQIMVSVIYLFIMMFASSFTSGGFDPGKVDRLLSDITALLIRQANNISGIYAILIILAAWLVIRALLRSNPLAIRREPVKKGTWAAAALLMAGVSGAIMLLMAGIQALGQTVPFIDQALQDYIKLSQNFISSGNILLVILTTCFVVPIAEDLVFRGIIQGELRRVMPGWTAVLLQGVIFALVHGNPIQITYVIIPAIMLGAVYEWTKSIYVPIAMHMLFNFAGAAIPLMLQGNQTGNTVFVLFEYAMIPVAVIAVVYLYKRRIKDSAENVSQMR